MEYVRRKQIGSFEVVAHLDTGGMADVFLVRHLALETFGVIKVLRERWKNESELVSMFQDEAQIMTRLNHPNVVRVFEHGLADGRPYIAMEYLDGDHLGLLVREVRRRSELLTTSLVARIGLQVANGLAYVHEAVDESGRSLGLVHRDVSPQNIFLCYDGPVKILDFGIALSIDRSTATRTGMLKGKLRYMSPEQVRQLPIDHRSDLFSLGIVLWEMLTCRRLFSAESDYATMRLICEEPVPTPAQLRPGMPETLQAIVMRCLERDPDRRFQTASELRRALSDFLFAGGGGQADEIPRAAARLLAGRQRQKQETLESIRQEQQLRAYLFGDLDTRDESDPGAIQRPDPQAVRPPERLAPAPQSPPLPPVTVKAAATPAASTAGLPISRGSRGWLTAIVLGLLVMAISGIVLWALWPRGDRSPADGGAIEDREDGGMVSGDTGEAVAAADGGTAVAADEGAEATADAGESGQESAEPPDASAVASTDGEDETPDDTEPDPKSKPVGFLRISTRPVGMDVFVDERFVGRTPLNDMELPVGRYRIKLSHSATKLVKDFSVVIRRDEVASFQFVY